MVNCGVSLHLINFVAICSFFVLCATWGETQLNTGADRNFSNKISFFRARQGSSESQIYPSRESKLQFGGTDYRQK